MKKPTPVYLFLSPLFLCLENTTEYKTITAVTSLRQLISSLLPYFIGCKRQAWWNEQNNADTSFTWNRDINMLMMSCHAITSRCGEGKDLLFCPRLIWKTTDVLQGTYMNHPKHFMVLHHDYFTENWSHTYRWKLDSSNVSPEPRPRIWSLFRKQCPSCLEWQMRAGRLGDSSLPLANHYLHSVQPYLEKTSLSWNLWQNSS